MDAESLRNLNYEIRFVGWLEHFEDPKDGNIDVRVLFENGDGHVSTLYTPENIRKLMNKERNWDVDDSMYFYDRSMVIVGRLEMDHIQSAIRCLIQRGDFLQCFEKESPIDGQ